MPRVWIFLGCSWQGWALNSPLSESFHSLGMLAIFYFFKALAYYLLGAIKYFFSSLVRLEKFYAKCLIWLKEGRRNCHTYLCTHTHARTQTDGLPNVAVSAPPPASKYFSMQKREKNGEMTQICWNSSSGPWTQQPQESNRHAQMVTRPWQQILDSLGMSRRQSGEEASVPLHGIPWSQTRLALEPWNMVEGMSTFILCCFSLRTGRVPKTIIE